MCIRDSIWSIQRAGWGDSQVKVDRIACVWCRIVFVRNILKLSNIIWRDSFCIIERFFEALEEPSLDAGVVKTFLFACVAEFLRRGSKWWCTIGLFSLCP